MVFRKIVSRIKEIINSNSQRVFVAIDGVDASGKTHFAQKLKEKFIIAKTKCLKFQNKMSKKKRSDQVD